MPKTRLQRPPHVANKPEITTADNYRRSLAKPVELPSGAVFRLRTVPIQSWWKAGRMPDQFMMAAMAAQARKEEGENVDLEAEGNRLLEQLDKTDSDKMARFMMDCVLYACIEPVVTEGEGNSAALSVDDIEPMDFSFIFAYSCQQAPGQTTPLTSGEEVPIESVRDFRESKQDKPSADTGDTVS